jgi:hypothetical protein
MLHFIAAFIGTIIIGFSFLLHNALTKPIYNKMSNVYEDDPTGRQYANLLLVIMLAVAFYLGTLL